MSTEPKQRCSKHPDCFTDECGCTPVPAREEECFGCGDTYEEHVISRPKGAPVPRMPCLGLRENFMARTANPPSEKQDCAECEPEKWAHVGKGHTVPICDKHFSDTTNSKQNSSELVAEGRLDEFVRDVCSVVPKSKSEVRRRLLEMLTQTRKEAVEESEKEKALYHELIMAVGNVYKGETRHMTALRYIRNAEQGSREVCSNPKVK